MHRKILVAGAAGFIGSNFVRYMLQHYPDVEIVSVDKLTYAGNLQNLAGTYSSRHVFIMEDICNHRAIFDIVKRYGVEAIINFAAETHVDKSIAADDFEQAKVFLDSNAAGVLSLLETARKTGLELLLQVSTDEVYGSVTSGKAKETDGLNPGNLYAATKAAADMLCMAYYNTHRVPVIITRSTNNYGPYQYPEKFVALAITNLLEGKKVPVYGKGENVRDWLYVEDHCAAIATLLEKGKPGEIYNIAAHQKVTNIQLLYMIMEAVGIPKQKQQQYIEFVEDRPGHDFAYNIDDSKTRAFGWKPAHNLKQGLEKTVAWYKNNMEWWKRIKSSKHFKEWLKKRYKQAS